VRNLGNLDQYSLYVTFSLTGLLELPADLLTIVTLDYLGRRWTNFGAMALGALFSLLAAAVQGSPLAVVVMAGCGRFCITMAMNTGLQYCVELLPTQLRGQGVNLVHIAGHISTFGGPLIVYLVRIKSRFFLNEVIKLQVFFNKTCRFFKGQFFFQKHQHFRVNLIKIDQPG